MNLKKRLLSSVLAVLMLAGCAGISAFADDDYTGGSPWLNPEIPGNVTEETAVDLKDNFALAVNKDIYATAEISEGYSYGGTLANRSLQLQQENVEMFSQADPTSSHDTELCLNLYNLLLDWDTRNSLGMDPIKDDLDAISAIDSLDALSAYFTETPVENILNAVILMATDTDLVDSSVRSLYVYQPSLLLGDADYYSQDSDLASTIRAAEAELATKLLVKAGYSEEDALDLVSTCLDFEAILAETCYSSADQLSTDYYSRMYNPMSVAKADELCGDFPLAEYIANFGYDTDSCIVCNPDYFSALADIYTEENVESIKAYILVTGLVSSASLLDRECYELVTECSNAIRGSQGMVSDEVYASSAVKNSLPWAVSHMYCDLYATEQEKSDIRALIDSVIAEYREMLSEETFISAETRDRALEKLDNLEIRCIYPDDWSPYDLSSVSFSGPEDGGTLRESSLAIARYQINRDVEKLSEPVTREIWPDGIYPSTLNCFYSPSDNSINILAAFARGELYNEDMSTEELYGTLGTVIGHEISHAFDSTGSQYDADGNFADWWTEDDYAAFSAKTQRISDYFSSITVWDGLQVNGSILTGEACADMGGMACILRLASELEDFDYDTFFRSYANLWARVETPNYAYILVAQDSHPLYYLRINAVLQQFDEFLDCYGISEGDGMYLAEADRIAVW